MASESYRVLYFDVQGRVIFATAFQAEDDEEAVRFAALYENWAALEVWRGGERIARLP